MSESGAVTRSLGGFIRRAARDVATDGWRVSGTGLAHQGADGTTGRIAFVFGLVDDTVGDTRVGIDMYAGAISPYLARIVNRLDMGFILQHELGVAGETTRKGVRNAHRQSEGQNRHCIGAADGGRPREAGRCWSV